MSRHDVRVVRGDNEGFGFVVTSSQETGSTIGKIILVFIEQLEYLRISYSSFVLHPLAFTVQQLCEFLCFLLSNQHYLIVIITICFIDYKVCAFYIKTITD